MTERDVPSEMQNVFEEKGENLSREELRDWSAEMPGDKVAVQKLTGLGAKLLIGPRGCGKSTLMRRAFFELADQGSVLPVYVSYSKSLALEPLFHRNANALRLFRQWVLRKIILAAEDGIRATGREPGDQIKRDAIIARKYISDLEQGLEPESEGGVGPSNLLGMLENWMQLHGFKRCVLLLDDAAHAFSAEQQREFFEIFRELKTRTVAPKAAVYPGITAYSPHLHIGHDAELIEAWWQVTEAQYVQTMLSIFEKRIPLDLATRLQGNKELVELIALASFGIPRSFLMMLSQLLGVEEDQTATSWSRLKRIIVANAESSRTVYRALTEKLPRYKNLIQVGRQLELAMCRVLQEYNKDKTDDLKAVVVAIKEPLGPELERMLMMQEYAGMVRKLDPLSRGVKGIFQRYMVHYSLLFAENSLSLGKAYGAGKALSVLKSRDAHAIKRTNPDALLGKDYREKCTLDLAPCSKCGAVRITEDAKFCVKCGAQLAEVSIYEELLKSSIDNLPLTANKIAGLKRHTRIKTVHDILLDTELKEVRKVPRVGPVWAARIRNCAEEYVSV